MDYRNNTEIIQHALKIVRIFRMLELDAIRKKKKKKNG